MFSALMYQLFARRATTTSLEGFEEKPPAVRREYRHPLGRDA
jgi:hypothetical protein